MAALLALGAVFGLIGPFGTYYDLGTTSRFIYWLVAMPLIGVPASLAMRAVMTTAPSAAWPIPVQAVVGAVIAGVPSTFVVFALETIFRQTPPVAPLRLLQIYGSVTVVIAFIGVPFILAVRRWSGSPPYAQPAPQREVPPPLPSTPPGVSPFLRRIPARLGTNLLYLATEDHYLRAVTDLGSDLILFRLSDALAELDPAAGQQVHRSYWVARSAVAAIERNGHRTTLVLTNGDQIPVSRTYLPALRDAGWLTT